MQLRAHDKLAEARFFLVALRRTHGALPRAAYYASAATAALRSVTWVLKADLFSQHGMRFDTWWEAERAKLSSRGIGFALLTDTRNEATKVGAPIVRRVVRREFPDGQIRALEFLIDPGFESIKNFRIKLDPPLTPATSGSLHTEAQANRAVAEIESLVSEFRSKASLLRDAWVDGSAPLSPVFGLKDDLPFPVALEQLEAYAKGLVELLESAERTFAT